MCKDLQTSSGVPNQTVILSSDEISFTTQGPNVTAPVAFGSEDVNLHISGGRPGVSDGGLCS